MNSAYAVFLRLCSFWLAIYCLDAGAFWDPIRISSIQVQRTGKVILGGDFSTFPGFEEKRVIRLNTDGTFDSSFNPPELRFESVNSICIQPDDKILIAGWSTNGIIRLNADGSLDQSFRLDPFRTALGIPGMQGLAMQEDGRIVAFGQFSQFADTEVCGLARFNSDGTFDGGFHPRLNLGISKGKPESILIQEDGKILLAGQFDHIDGVPADAVARLYPDGTLDGTFGFTDLDPFTTRNIHDLQDGKIIVPGPLGITRLLPNGAHDKRFNPGLGIGGTESYVYSARVQRGTNILIYGRFDRYDDIPRKSFARINDDGTLDHGFDAQFAQSSRVTFPSLLVRAACVLPDQSFYVGGSFTEAQGKPRAAIARFTPDGKVDETFNAFRPICQVGSVTEDGFYRCVVAGEKGRPYRIEVSADLKLWEPLRNIVITAGPFEFIDLRPLGETPRFYRVASL